ncbi:phage portal protein [Nocardia thailandica]
MPETITAPGLGDDDERTLNRLNEQLNRKARRNRMRSRYYDGKRAARAVTPIMPPLYQRLALTLGWSAKAVDLLARRCNPEEIIWADGDLASLGLSEVLDGNSWRSEINAAIVSSLIHSCSILINTEGDTDAGEAKSLIHVKSALDATGDWNARTRGLDTCLSVTGRDDKGNPTGFALYLRNRTIVIELDERGRWEITAAPEHKLGVPAEVLAYKPRPGRPFGSSRLSRVVMSLHDAGIRSLLRLEGHADIYSIPELVTLGADESVFQNADGSQRPMWEVMMGRIKFLPDDPEAPAGLQRAQVQQIAAASPAPHLDIIKQQAQLFSGETSIPLSSLGVSDMSNPTSADSYIASREDLIAEAEGTTDDMTTPVRRSMARALAIQNDLDEIPDEFATIGVKWRSPMYLSRAAVADAGQKVIASVPWLAETEVGLELLGLTEPQRRQAISEKRRLAGSGVLDKLAAAAAARGGQPAPGPAAEAPAAEAVDEQPVTATP